MMKQGDDPEQYQGLPAFYLLYHAIRQYGVDGQSDQVIVPFTVQNEDQVATGLSAYNTNAKLKIPGNRGAPGNSSFSLQHFTVCCEAVTSPTYHDDTTR